MTEAERRECTRRLEAYNAAVLAFTPEQHAAVDLIVAAVLTSYQMSLDRSAVQVTVPVTIGWLIEKEVLTGKTYRPGPALGLERVDEA